MSETFPYSYHTFILPFAWKTTGDEYKKFVDYFDHNDFWTCTDMEDSNDLFSAKTVETEEERLVLYKEYQYFTAYARKAIYGFDEKIVRNYSFMHEQLHNKATYQIKKGDKEYTLMLNAIRLKIYNSGIALFIMECENTNPNQFSVNDVKDINEYGRRITLPFINPYYSLCADSLSVVIGEIKFISDFKSFIDSPNRQISMNHMADFIKEILKFGGEYSFSSHKVTDKKSFWIYPLLGDRMFVSCIVADPDYASNAKMINTAEKDSDERYEKAKDIYELAFIDNSGGISCNNKDMIFDLLKKATYLRWLDYKTAYYITNYSFVMLLEKYASVEYLVENFLTQYYQMYCLVLAQKASIVQFKREIASISSGFEKKKKKIKAHTITDIMTLEERYVAFEAQMCFDEVSPEQQGIQLYDMLKSQFGIREEENTLKSQIENLYNAANTCIGFETDNNVMIFTWIAFLVSVASLAVATLQTFYNNSLEGANLWVEGLMTQNAVWISIFGIALVSIGSILAYLIIKLMNRRA